MESDHSANITEDLFTSSEDLENMLPGETSYELIGVITKIENPFRRRSGFVSENAPMRCIFSNLQKNIRTLFWAPKRDEFKGRLLDKILRITRPQIVKSNPQFFKAEENVMEIEISIQKYTEVEILGPWATNQYLNIEIENVLNYVERCVCIHGFLKVTFQSIVNGNSSFGSGSNRFEVLPACSHHIIRWNVISSYRNSSKN